MFFFHSLDVEGAEFPIITTIPFDKVDIKIMGIESPHLGKLYPGTFKELTKYLYDQGYDYFRNIAADAFFIKRGYLNELNEF